MCHLSFETRRVPQALSCLGSLRYPTRGTRDSDGIHIHRYLTSMSRLDNTFPLPTRIAPIIYLQHPHILTYSHLPLR